MHHTDLLIKVVFSVFEHNLPTLFLNQSSVALYINGLGWCFSNS